MDDNNNDNGVHGCIDMNIGYPFTSLNDIDNDDDANNGINKLATILSSVVDISSYHHLLQQQQQQHLGRK